MARYPRGYKETRLRDSVEAAFKQGAYDALTRVASGLETGLPGVVENIKGAAAENMNEAYQRAMADETGTINKAEFLQANPAASVNASRVEVTSGSSYHARWRTMGALKKITIEVRGVDTDTLDSTPDRSISESLSAQIALPLVTGKAPGVGGVLRRIFNMSPNVVYIKDITVRARSGRKNSLTVVGMGGQRGTKKIRGPWKLWRALEYGDVAGRYGRVWVRSVKSFTPAKSMTYTNKEGESVERVLAVKESVEYGDWVVFMTSRIAWWEKMAGEMGTDVIRVDAPGTAYHGGEHPIERAIIEMRGATQQRVGEIIRDSLKRGL